MSVEDGKKGRGFFGKLFGTDQKPESDTNAEAVVDDAADVSEEIRSTKDSEPQDLQPVDDSPQQTGEDAGASAKSPSLKQAEDSKEEPKKVGWFQRLTAGLGRTSSKLSDGITRLFTKGKLDAETLDDLEDLLIQSDIGVPTAARICDVIGKGRFEKGISPEEVRSTLAAEVERVLQPVAQPLAIEPSNKPHVIMMVGVNGTGKTTTIGKLAARFQADGKTVMLAAGDTFRAAAIDQLKVWGERTGAPVIARDVGADAAGLAFDALKAAKEQNIDVLLLDTAGRLQNKQGLMDELKKVTKVLKKKDNSAPHSVLLVLDATTGQNALSQVDVFREQAGVTGIVMTKLDGTARGGILVAISEKAGLPIHAIGVGEGVDDLQPFKAADFARALAHSD